LRTRLRTRGRARTFRRIANFEARTGDTLYGAVDNKDASEPTGGRSIETETKSILVKDVVVILVAVGGLLAFYAVIQVVSFLANIRP